MVGRVDNGVAVASRVVAQPNMGLRSEIRNLIRVRPHWPQNKQKILQPCILLSLSNN
eukprot:UN01754